MENGRRRHRLGRLGLRPGLNLLYFGTGNGTFYDQSKRSPNGGDNLYIASIIALNPDTGRMASWYYQEVPGDQWDFDVVQPIILANLKIDGKMRKVLMQASKPGFFLHPRSPDRQTSFRE